MNDQHRPRRMTLKDVAAILGVSTATVSNAFNRPDQLSAAMRKRVLGEAERLGYAGPDAKARTLRTGRSRIIAVVLAENLTYSLNDPVANALLAGIAGVLDEHDHTLMLLPGRDRLAYTLSRASIADGVIVYGLMTNPRLLMEPLRLAQQPAVTVDCDIGGYPAVHIDDEAASYRIASHALSHRPRRVAIIGLRLIVAHCNGAVPPDAIHHASSDSIARLRLEGFRRALDEHAPTCEVDLWNVEENTPDMILPVVQTLLDAPASTRPDLVLCMSDRIALTVLAQSAEQGLTIPADLRVTGFDGIEEGRYRYPTLTTVCQDSAEKGRRAARLVLGLGDDVASLVPARLIVGQSCP